MRNTRERERRFVFLPPVRGQSWLDFSGHGIAVGIFLLYQEEEQGQEKSNCEPSPEAGTASQRQKKIKRDSQRWCLFLFHGLSFWEGGEDTSPLAVRGKRAVKNLFMKEKYAVCSVIDKNQCFVSMTGP